MIRWPVHLLQSRQGLFSSFGPVHGCGASAGSCFSCIFSFGLLPIFFHHFKKLLIFSFVLGFYPLHGNIFEIIDLMLWIKLIDPTNNWNLYNPRQKSWHTLQYLSGNLSVRPLPPVQCFYRDEVFISRLQHCWGEGGCLFYWCQKVSSPKYLVSMFSCHLTGCVKDFCRGLWS